MFSSVEAGQKNRDDRDFPWTPMTRRAFLTPSIYSPSPEDRVFKQPEGVRRFSRPLPARGFNQFVANGANIPNKERVLTPHIYDRKNFMAPSVLPRSAGLMGADYDASPQDIADGGLTKLLTKPIDINVPDSRDLEWIAERAKLDAEGKPHVLPFGRQQMTFKKNVKLVDEFVRGLSHTHGLKEKLNVIDESVKAGIGKTNEGITKMGVQLSLILSQNAVSKTLSTNELNKAYKLISELKITDNWRKENFPHRFLSSSEFQPIKMKVFLFMLSHINKNRPTGFDPTNPIPKIRVNAKGQLEDAKAVDIGFLIQRLVEQKTPTLTGAPPLINPAVIHYVDLERFAVVPFGVALNDTRAGRGNHKLNGFRVPAAPTDVKKMDVIPLGIYNPGWAKKQGITIQDQADKGVNINPLAVIDNKLVELPHLAIARQTQVVITAVKAAQRAAASQAAKTKRAALELKIQSELKTARSNKVIAGRQFKKFRFDLNQAEAELDRLKKKAKTKALGKTDRKKVSGLNNAVAHADTGLIRIQGDIKKLDADIIRLSKPLPPIAPLVEIVSPPVVIRF